MADSQKAPIVYVLDLVKEIVPIPKIPEAIGALFPMLRELAMSEEVLTDERRADLSARVLTTLRRIGLEGVDIK